MSAVDVWRDKVVTPGKGRKEKGVTPPSTARGDMPKARFAQRPHSASAVCHDKLRPLGKAPQKFASITASKWQPANNSMERGYITKLKTEILSLQRRIDEVNLKGHTGVSSDMADLEQTLFHLQYDTDTARLFKVHVTLFELLLKGIKNLALGIIEKARSIDIHTRKNDSRPTSASSCSAVTAPVMQGHGARALRESQDDGSNSPPSRIEPLLFMTDLFYSVIERQLAWKELISQRSEKDCDYIPEGAAEKSPATPAAQQNLNFTIGSSVLDDALNQPAVSQLQLLIKEQEKLQSTFATQLAAAEAIRATTATQTDAVKEPERAVETPPPAPVETKESPKSIAKYKHLLKQIQEASKHSAVAYADISDAQLERFNVRIAGRVQIQPPAAEALAAKIQAIIAETLGEQDAPKEEEKEKAGKGKKPPVEEKENTDTLIAAQMHLALMSQNKTLKSMARALEESDEKHRKAMEGADRVRISLKHALEAERDKLIALAQSNDIESHRLRDMVKNKETEYEKLKERLCSVMHSQQKTKRSIVHTNKDPPAEDYYVKELLKKNRSYELEGKRLMAHCSEIETQLETVRSMLDSSQRENSNFRQLLKKRSEECEQMNRENEALEEEMQKAREAAGLSNTKALSSVENKEADLDTIRKLSIELSICRNTIAGLRKNEDIILKGAKEAEWKCVHIKNELEQEKMKGVNQRVEMEHAMERLKEAAEVSNRAEHEARRELSRKQAEMTKLRLTEEKLQNLQRDFRNYTMSKIKQGEATEEEERRLQECLVMLNTDLFILPEALNFEDVELTINQLEEKKRNLDAAQRQAEKLPQKKSTLGQIVEVLKRRMNAIQLYAFTEKKNVFSLEEELRSLKQVLVMCRSEQQVDMASAKASASKLDATIDTLKETIATKEELQHTVEELSLQIRDQNDTTSRLSKQVEMQQEELALTGSKLEETSHLLGQKVQ